MQADLTQAVELMLDVYLLKIIAAGIIFIGATALKDMAIAWMVRRNLIRMEAIHVDKYVKIGDVEGYIRKIGLTHVKIETKTGFGYVPSEYLVKRALILCPNMEKKPRR